MRPAGLREPLERGQRVVEQRPAHVRIDVEPPRRVGELERPRGRIARRLVRARELGPHRRPPRLRLAQLGMRHVRPVPREALAQVRPERVGGVPVPRLLGVERLGEQDAPAGLASPVRERAVEVPDQQPRPAHPTSWKTTRVTSAPSAPPYTTSSGRVDARLDPGLRDEQRHDQRQRRDDEAVVVADEIRHRDPAREGERRVAGRQPAAQRRPASRPRLRRDHDEDDEDERDERDVGRRVAHPVEHVRRALRRPRSRRRGSRSRPR